MRIRRDFVSEGARSHDGRAVPQPMSRETPGSSSDLMTLLFLLRRRWLLLFGWLLLAISAAAAYIVVTPRTYTASAGILIDFNAAEVLSSNPASRGTAEIYDSITDSHLLLLKSPGLARRVIEKLQLQHDPEFASDGSNSLLRSTGLTEQPDREVQWGNIVDLFLSNTSVDRQGRTYVLTISFQSQEAQKAAEIANEIAATHIASLLEQKQIEAKEALKWLQSRIAEVRDELYNTEMRLQTAGLDTMSVRDLEMSVHALKTTYQNLQDRYNFTVQQASSPFVEARVVTPASAPLRPSHPRRSLILFGTLILGSGVGLLLVYLRDLIDPHVRTADQVERVTGAHCFGPMDVSARAKRVGASGRYSSQKDDALQEFVTRILIAGQLGEVRRVGITAVDRSTAKSVVAARLAELLAQVEDPPRSKLTMASVLNPDKTHVFEQHGLESSGSIRTASVAGLVSAPQGQPKDGIIVVDLPSLDSGSDAVSSIMAVDACIIVVARRATRLASLKAAVARFRFPPGFILGTLMTRT